MNPRTIGLLITLILISILFNSYSNEANRFLEWRNILRMLTMTVNGAYVACASTLLMIEGSLDLSMNRMAAFTGVILAKLLAAGIPTPVSVLLMFVSAALAGTVNSILTYEFKMPSFIATLGFATVLQGLTMTISRIGGRLFSNSFLTWLGTGKFGGEVPVRLVITFILLAVYTIALKSTKTGISIYLVGGNSKAAVLSGLSHRKIHYLLYINSAVLCSIAAMIQMGSYGGGTAINARYGEFTGITYALLGGVSFYGGSGSLGATFLGLVIITWISNGLTLLRIPSAWDSVVSGGFLLFVLALSHINLRSKIRFKPTGRI